MHDPSDDQAWHATQTQFTADLHAAAQTAESAYAVGASGTNATSTEHGWVPVVEAGPDSKNSTLRTVDATSDGNRLWFAGADGALGMYDVEERHHHGARGRHKHANHEHARTGRAHHECGGHHEHTVRGGHAEGLPAEELDITRLRKLLGC